MAFYIVQVTRRSSIGLFFDPRALYSLFFVPIMRIYVVLRMVHALMHVTLTYQTIVAFPFVCDFYASGLDELLCEPD